MLAYIHLKQTRVRFLIYNLVRYKPSIHIIVMGSCHQVHHFFLTTSAVLGYVEKEGKEEKL